MQFTYTRVDVPAYERTGSSPHVIVPRAVGEIWVVLHEPMVLGGKPQWCFHRKESQIYVPMHPYLVPVEPDKAFGFMLQLGFNAASSIQQPVRRMHLALGHPVHEVNTPELGTVWQCQFGLAVLLT